MLIKDTSGSKSITMTAFVVGFIIVNIKLIFSGMAIYGFELAPFTGAEYAAAVGALGAVYVLRRSTSAKPKEEEKDDVSVCEVNNCKYKRFYIEQKFSKPKDNIVEEHDSDTID